MILCGAKNSFVVDTGPSMSIVSADTFNRIPAARRSKIEKVDKALRLEAMSIGLMLVNGIVNCPLKLMGTPMCETCM